MDMQGQPIGGNNASTKVTSNSQAQKPIREGAGPIASDSLAAESANAGGLFDQNRDSNPQSVSGSNSTFANTDTSGATTLAPARDAASRDDVWNESGAGQKYPEGAGGQGQFSGSHAGGTYSGGSSAAKRDFKQGTSGEGYDTSGSGGAFSDSGAGGPSADKISSSSGGGQKSERSTGDTQQSSTSYSSGTGGSSGGSGAQVASGNSSGSTGTGGSSDVDVDVAPGYVSSVTQPLNTAGPKGAAVEGSDEDFKGESNQGAEIGSKNDPGLRAEQKYQTSSASSSGAAGARQGQVTGSTAYDSLKGSEQA